MKETMHLDLTLLQGYLDNLGLNVVQQMVDLYLGQSVIYLADIERSTSNEKQQEWKDNCHKMKGAAGSVGLVLVHKMLVDIEKSTETPNNKLIMFNELEQLNKVATGQFMNWLSKE